MPGYGRQHAAAARSLWRASRNMDEVRVQYQCGSLLAQNFNSLWCAALNLTLDGEPCDYFAMLHDDIGAEDFWLDNLIDELDSRQLDALGVAIPIKDTRGLSSIAVHKDGDNWRPECRLTMRELHRLPSTFTSKDLGGRKLLLNTGMWACRFDPAWNTLVHFEINDRIAFNQATGRYQAVNESEDWFFSRLLHELGLRIGATRKIAAEHYGEMAFANYRAWGTHQHDADSIDHSIVPLVDADGYRFPHDVEGWLRYDEGKELWQLAQGKRVLEIGSYCGCSTVSLAQTAHSVTAVDPHDGRGTPCPQPTREKLLANLRRYEVGDRVKAHSSLAELNGETFDLVFIDGDHSYEAVRSDIKEARGRLMPGGVVAFHDYRSPSDPGVTRAVDELIADGGELLSVVDTLAIVRPPAHPLPKEPVNG
jgi:SAM-dependent methyltransferase